MAYEVKGVVARSKGAPVTIETIVCPDPGPGEAGVDVPESGGWDAADAAGSEGVSELVGFWHPAVATTMQTTKAARMLAALFLAFIRSPPSQCGEAPCLDEERQFCSGRI